MEEGSKFLIKDMKAKRNNHQENNYIVFPSAVLLISSWEFLEKDHYAVILLG